ncbi:hypothetical protein BDZ45DRAFT_675468 [Acephala macrosclerotiorum]|nr:hypothetical protein BDZ45DRAFT_675468 [Acephala macrosclerotiorum]
MVDFWSLDYRETAARLQKEWNIRDPQTLPFAAHVDHHALVGVLNRGLLYNSKERDTTKVCRPVFLKANPDPFRPY